MGSGGRVDVLLTRPGKAASAWVGELVGIGDVGENRRSIGGPAASAALGW